MTNWDLTFIRDTHDTEVCPMCGHEVEIKCNGTSDCPECGHPEILPCTECTRYNEPEMCDWTPEDRCTPFRRTQDDSE